jgi:hypothetical protein
MIQSAKKSLKKETAKQTRTDLIRTIHRRAESIQSEVLRPRRSSMKLTCLKVQALSTLMVAATVCVGALMLPAVFAQEKSSDTNMQILRDKIKSDKKLVVAANMDLTEAEAKKFWPIYDAYQKDLQSINERLKKVILDYADGYNNNSLTDAQAKKLSDEALAIEADEAKMRKDYSGKLNAVVPAKKAARYLQIENKIRAVIRYDLADGIPLVP